MVTTLDIWTPDFAGLSTDTKPDKAAGARNGSDFCEIDTGKHYVYDEKNDTWYDQAPEPEE